MREFLAKAVQFSEKRAAILSDQVGDLDEIYLSGIPKSQSPNLLLARPQIGREHLMEQLFGE